MKLKTGTIAIGILVLLFIGASIYYVVKPHNPQALATPKCDELIKQSSDVGDARMDASFNDPDVVYEICNNIKKLAISQKKIENTLNNARISSARTMPRTSPSIFDYTATVIDPAMSVYIWFLLVLLLVCATGGLLGGITFSLFYRKKFESMETNIDQGVGAMIAKSDNSDIRKSPNSDDTTSREGNYVDTIEDLKNCDLIEEKINREREFEANKNPIADKIIEHPLLSDGAELPSAIKQPIAWPWLSEIFGEGGILVNGDEFDRILYTYTSNIYNIDFYNASFTLSSYQDTSVPTDARLLLLEIGTGVPALVIPSYGFVHRFSNTIPVVANYASSELFKFFEMVPDGSSELKLVRPALISRSGKEWDIDTIQKGELRGFHR